MILFVLILTTPIKARQLDQCNNKPDSFWIKITPNIYTLIIKKQDMDKQSSCVYYTANSLINNNKLGVNYRP